MAKFELKTTFQFPFFKVTELVKYTEVKKPSGIAYMLLVLINESKDKKANLSLLLENYGIPKTLHSIFIDALNELNKEEIISVNENVDEFDDYIINDFKFTNKGKKVFSEESLPTGKIKEKKIPVYYNIALNCFSLGLLDSNMDPKPLMVSAITPEFMNQFTINKDIENYLNLNKGKIIPIYDENSRKVDDVTIKKEEVITEVEKISQTNWVAKYDCTIKIDNDSLEFDFDTDTLKKFFEKYYSSDIINKLITLKTKYKFYSAYANDLKLSDFKDFEISQVLIPKELTDVLKKKIKLLITKGNYTNSELFMITEKTGLDNLSKSCEFVTVDQDNTIYAYVPGVFDFKNEVFGGIKIPLVLKLKISLEELQQVLIPYLKKKTDYSEETFKEIVKLTNISKDTKCACDILNSYMLDNPENNIVLLNEIKDSAITNEAILQLYKLLLEDNYHKYIESLNEDKLETFLKITHNVPKFININENDVLAMIFQNIKKIISPLNVYEKLIEAGFDRRNVINYVNPLPEVLHGEYSTDNSIHNFINYKTCIENLKSLTTITNVLNYVLDLEEIDKTEFKKNYSTAFSLINEVEVFKNANQELYNDMVSFMLIFKNINDYFNMHDEALKNPNKINQELIEKKIVDGDYQFVFINLAAKLESTLKNKFKLDGTLHEKLANARKNNLIDKNVISDLFDFKDNRNAYIHPEDRNAKFQIDDIRRWSKEIFELSKEEKNESSSSN